MSFKAPTKHRLTRHLPALALVVSILLPALPVYADANSDTGTGGSGGSIQAPGSAGRRILCRINGGSLEGWGTLTDADRYASSRDLGQNSSLDSSRAQGTKTTVNGNEWTWDKGKNSWFELWRGGSPGETRRWGGPNGKIWTWVVSGTGGFTNFAWSGSNATWAVLWYRDYPNCDPIRCPGGTCTSSGSLVPTSVWCLPTDKSSLSDAVRMLPSDSLQKCEVGINPTSDTYRLCQTYWEVWRFYGKSRSADPASFYTISRVPLARANNSCPAATLHTNSVFFSPHPADGPDKDDPRAVPSSGVKLFDGGFVYWNAANGVAVVAPAVYGPTHTATNEVYTTTRPFYSGGTPGADCTVIQNKDAGSNPYHGDSDSAKALREERYKIYKSQGYSDALANSMANQKSDGSWDDGLACSSGAEFAVSESVPPASRPVYGACWVPVMRAAVQNVSKDRVASYTHRVPAFNLNRYGISHRSQLQLSGPDSLIDKFVVFVRSNYPSVIVSSIDYQAEGSKTVFFTSSEDLSLNSTDEKRFADFEGYIKDLWNEASKEHPVLDISKVAFTKVSAATSRPSGALGHHTAWKDEIRKSVVRRYNQALVGKSLDDVIWGMGIGHPENLDHSKYSRWVPANPYVIGSNGKMENPVDYKVTGAASVAEAAVEAAVCADGPMAAGDFTPPSATIKVKISAPVEVSSSTSWRQTEPWTTDSKTSPCIPPTGASDADREACAALDKLSPAERAEVLKVATSVGGIAASSDKAKEAWGKKFVELVASRKPFPAKVELGTVASVEWQFGSAASKTTIEVEAVVEPKCAPEGPCGSTIKVQISAPVEVSSSTSWRQIKPWNIGTCTPPAEASDADKEACDDFNKLDTPDRAEVLEVATSVGSSASTSNKAKEAWVSKFVEISKLVAANKPLPSKVELGTVASVEWQFGSAASKTIIDVEAVVYPECGPKVSCESGGSNEAVVTISNRATLPSVASGPGAKPVFEFSDWRVGPCIASTFSASLACDAFNSLSKSASRATALRAAATDAGSKYIATYDTSRLRGELPPNPSSFKDVGLWTDDLGNTVRINAVVGSRQPNPGPCPGDVCFEGDLDSRRPSSGGDARPSAIVTLVVPRTFGTGAGLFSQKITAVVHDYVAPSAICDRGDIRGAANSTSKDGDGNAGAFYDGTCKTDPPVIDLNLAAWPVSGEVRADISQSISNLQCGNLASGGFLGNYTSKSCTKELTVNSYRASGGNGGIAYKVSASGESTVRVTEFTEIKFPSMCLEDVLRQLPSFSARNSIECNVGSELNPVARSTGYESLPIPQNLSVGKIGIKFDVRVVFEEHIGNPDAHDTLWDECKNRVDCRIRPVISSSATSRR